MSSQYVREQIKSFLDTNAPSEDVIELDGEFGEINEVVEEAGLGPNDPWLGLQFLGGDEVPVSLTAANAVGKYREDGVIFLHVTAIAKIGGQAAMLTRANNLMNSFRGQRINGDIVIDSMTPPNFGNGAAMQFEGGYTSCVVSVGYHRDINL